MTNPFKIENLSRYRDFARLWMKYGGKGILSSSRPNETFELKFSAIVLVWNILLRDLVMRRGKLRALKQGGRR